MGMFINVEVDSQVLTQEQRRDLVPLCPVDIFVLQNEQICVRPEQEDECTLCELCLAAAPKGTVKITKLYKDEILVSRGGAS